MIINREKKFIFIGLPFSASSAISKELLEQYNCEALLHKNANIPVLLKCCPDIKIDEYEVVAVIRDPVETAFTLYNKLKNNANETYSNPMKFIENGGHVTKKARRTYQKIQSKNLSFDEYLDNVFGVIPFDGLLSENCKYITKTIHFDDLQGDFKACFESLGVNVVRELPSYNKTKNKLNKHDLTDRQVDKYFGAFINHNSVFFPKYKSTHVSVFDNLRFQVFRKLKSYNRLRIDMKLKDSWYADD